MTKLPHALLVLVTFTAPAFANVTVTSPTNGETASSPVRFVATANTTTCSQGVASMGIYIDNQLDYVVNAMSMNTTLPLAAGPHNAVVQEWDRCGGATKTAVPITVEQSSGVWVSWPANNTTIAQISGFVATATSSCDKGVSSMGIYVDSQRVYVVGGAALNHQLSLAPGSHRVVIEEWDGCGGAAVTPLSLTVQGNNHTFYNLQRDDWKSWGQEAPLDIDCGAPCPGDAWSMQQDIKAPSLSGDATQFNLAGTKPYSDVLFYNQLIGDFSTQNLPDTAHSLIPTLHNYVYNTDVYVADASVTQALEFDVNMFFDGIGMTFGTECRIEGGYEWDIWDNVAAHWVPTGVACNPVNRGWNHVTVQVERDANNNVVFQSIALNGVTAVLNKSYAPFTVPADWYGVVCDFQMDGNYAQDPYSAYLDNTTFTYW
jgi:hypothetical protein